MLLTGVYLKSKTATIGDPFPSPLRRRVALYGVNDQLDAIGALAIIHGRTLVTVKQTESAVRKYVGGGAIVEGDGGDGTQATASSLHFKLKHRHDTNMTATATVTAVTARRPPPAACTSN